MKQAKASIHPHGMGETRFVELFTANRPIVFVFQGCQRAIHEIVHGHVNAERFHVRRSAGLEYLAPTLISECEALISGAHAREHLEDQPELLEWWWTP